MDYDAELDAPGLLVHPCPFLRRANRLSAFGQRPVACGLRAKPIPAAIIDVPHYCFEAGHTLGPDAGLKRVQVYFYPPRRKRQRPIE